MYLSDQQKDIIGYMQDILKPKPFLTGSEWMDKYFYLSPESSAKPGKWKTHPWQKEIIDCMTDFESKIVGVQKPTRVGFTKMGNGVKAYFIHQQPCVILDYQPTDDEAKGYAEDEFEPMIRDNPMIAKLIETPSVRGRQKREKTIKKRYPNGFIEMLGAESDRNLNRRTARVAMGDEVDTWKKEAGKAGDTVTQMMRRTSDFVYRKNIIGGKPIGAEYDDEKEIDDGVSVVNYWYQQGDMRLRHLPCPHCDHLQLFEFEDFVWEKDQGDEGNTIKHYPDTVHFVCEQCEEKIYDHHKKEMDEKGEWIAQKPFHGIATFRLWAMLSDSPNVTWPDIVKEFLKATKSKAKYKSFLNEVLARTWEEEFEKVEIDGNDRLEEYKAQIPNGVLVLSSGVDVQKNRLELELVGWGANEESWSITYKIFAGDTSKPDVWKDLDEFLLKTFEHEDGSRMRIYTTAIDTGYRATKVYEFCKTRYNRRVFAVKGSKTITSPLVPRVATKTKKTKGALLYLVGVNEGKNIISSHVMTVEVGPGYMHFPNDRIYNDEYFKQLTSEKKLKSGAWVKMRSRNEAFDVRNYSYIAMFLANVDLELLALRNQKIGVVIAAATKKIQNRNNHAPKSHLDEF